VAARSIDLCSHFATQLREGAVLEKLDAQQRLTANQWKIAFAATIGDMLDFFDFGLIGFVLAFIVKDWHLTFGESGLILLASGISAPFGSLLWAGPQTRSAGAKQ
jgi:hypothetical protein